MQDKKTISVSQVIDFLEKNLNRKLTLSFVAEEFYYSKYHLHRMFADTVGMSIHEYAKRRQLTEAAKFLVFSEKSIMEIAMLAGYDSQQSFTDAFKAIYKKTPNLFRQEREFYPLQLKFVLQKEIVEKISTQEWENRIAFAQMEDMADCLVLAALAIDGFPHFDHIQYEAQLTDYIEKRQALLIRQKGIVIGSAGFSRETGSIDYLGIHPQYRNTELAKAFLKRIFDELLFTEEISITTYRHSDRADTGYRDSLKKLGFAEAELLTEYGYPTQRFVLEKKKLFKEIKMEQVEEQDE